MAKVLICKGCENKVLEGCLCPLCDTRAAGKPPANTGMTMSAAMKRVAVLAAKEKENERNASQRWEKLKKEANKEPDQSAPKAEVLAEMERAYELLESGQAKTLREASRAIGKREDWLKYYLARYQYEPQRRLFTPYNMHGNKNQKRGFRTKDHTPRLLKCLEALESGQADSWSEASRLIGHERSWLQVVLKKPRYKALADKFAPYKRNRQTKLPLG